MQVTYAVMDSGYTIQEFVTIDDSEEPTYPWPGGTTHVNVNEYLPDIENGGYSYNPGDGTFTPPYPPFQVQGLNQVDSVGGSYAAANITPSGAGVFAFDSGSNAGFQSIASLATAVVSALGSGSIPNAKVSGLSTVGTTGAYSDLSGKPSLATIATTGAYSDLFGKPSLATVATTGAYSDLSGKPTLGTASAQNVSAFLQPSNNLSEITSASTARINLGLGTAATANTGIFLQASNNLSDLGSASTARTNLGVPLIQSTRVQTASNGSYTWTFPTAYASAPKITATVENSSTTVSYNVQVGTPTTTSVTAQVFGIQTALGILGFASSPQTYIHLTAVG